MPSPCDKIIYRLKVLDSGHSESEGLINI